MNYCLIGNTFNTTFELFTLLKYILRRIELHRRVMFYLNKQTRVFNLLRLICTYFELQNILLLLLFMDISFEVVVTS